MKTRTWIASLSSFAVVITLGCALFVRTSNVNAEHTTNSTIHLDPTASAAALSPKPFRIYYPSAGSRTRSSGGGHIVRIWSMNSDGSDRRFERPMQENDWSYAAEHLSRPAAQPSKATRPLEFTAQLPHTSHYMALDTKHDLWIIDPESNQAGFLGKTDGHFIIAPTDFPFMEQLNKALTHAQDAYNKRFE